MSASETRADVVRFSVDRGLVRGLGVAVAAAVLLALTEAFGMSGNSLLFRLGYWLPMMLLGLVIRKYLVTGMTMGAVKE